jgi:hypothetical protein
MPNNPGQLIVIQTTVSFIIPAMHYSHPPSDMIHVADKEMLISEVGEHILLDYLDGLLHNFNNSLFLEPNKSVV